MKLIDLLDLVLGALQGDAALETYCLIEYGREPQIFASHSGDFPPRPEDCPYILVHSPGKSGHQERGRPAYGLTIDFFVYDTEDEARADDAYVSMGVRRLMEMMRLSRAAIVAVMPRGFVTGYEDVTDTVTLWPLLPGTTVYDFEQMKFVGTDPLD